MEFQISISGTHTLLMHNSQLSDPTNPFTRRVAEISSKKKKVLEDHEELALREWDGGLYFHPEYGPFIPGMNIERCLLDSARMNRLGKSIERGVFITSDYNALQYDGPRDVQGLRGNPNFKHMASAKVGMSRIMRCRPMFREWAVVATGELDTEQMELSDLQRIADNAGRLIGLGDWRPRFGRFRAQVAAL